MTPIDGILQFSLDGDLQRIICESTFSNAWSMKVAPQHFLQSAPVTFGSATNVLVVASGNELYFIDIDSGQNGRLLKTVTFPQCRASGHIGDFTFTQSRNGQSLLILNLQEGM